MFSLIEEPPAKRIVQTAIPCRRGVGGVSLLETFVLIAGSQIVGTTRAFEFGTFLGATTLNLALNLPARGKVFTLDLSESDAHRALQDVADAPLTETHLAAKSSLDFAGTAVAHKVKTLTGDSKNFDFSKWHSSMDLVFVDGGHDVATVKSDTENALRLVRRDKASCIFWHDYGNRDYGALTSYLDELSQSLVLVHIQDTMLCAWFHDPGDRFLPRLVWRTPSI